MRQFLGNDAGMMSWTILDVCRIDYDEEKMLKVVLKNLAE